MITIAQILILPWLRLMGRFFFPAQVRAFDGPLPAETSYVLAANHQSKLDPLIIIAKLPLSVCLRLLPYRFFIYNSYFDTWYLHPLLKLMGGFPSHQHPTLPYGLAAAEQSLSEYSTVVIFPEGRRTRAGETEPKRGVSALAELAQVEIIPVHINWSRRGRVSSIVVGQPFSGHGLSAQSIMDKIYALK